MTNKCTIEGCVKQSVGRGYCQMHYRRFRLYGDPNFVLRKQRDQQSISKIIINEDHALVKLTNNKFALIDLEDIEKVKIYNWYYSTSTGYAYSNKAGTSLHQFLKGRAPQDMIISHENENKLDCRKINLEFRTQSYNRRNSVRWRNERGIAYHKQTGRYQAYVHFGREQVFLGIFATEFEAKRAREIGIEISSRYNSAEVFKETWKKNKRKYLEHDDKIVS